MPRALLPIVIATALLVGCTGGDDRPASAVPTQTPVVTATVAAPPVATGAAAPRATETPSTPEPPPPSVALTPEPFPTSVVHVPFVDGLPVGVSGPLVVYSGQVGAELTRGRSWRVIEVCGVRP